MGLPELKGDPCWVFDNGPYTIERRNRIREQAGDRKFIKIVRDNTPWQVVPIFEFNADVAQSVEHIVANDKAEGS